MYFSDDRHIDTDTKTKTEPHESLSTGTFVKVIEVPIVVSNTELEGTRHSSVAARGGGFFSSGGNDTPRALE